jgi:hypothetical protein
MRRILLATFLVLGRHILTGLGVVASLGVVPGLGMLTSSVALADDLPVPPIPPEHPPLAETAPVPDADATAPVVAASNEPSFDVRLYRARPYDPGMGFTPGSRYQDSEDRKAIQTPGFSISVPLK